MPDRALTTCDQCGQTDDHPKVHDIAITKHHDCLSAAEERELRASSAAAGEVVDAAKAGTHGDELLTLITSLHEES